MSDLDSKLRCLAAELLDMAADRFGNDVCTDWDWPQSWTAEEKETAFRAYHEWNGDPEDATGEPALANFCAMSLCAAWLRREVLQPAGKRSDPEWLEEVGRRMAELADELRCRGNS